MASMPGNTRLDGHLPPLKIEMPDFIDGMSEEDSQFPQYFAAVKGYHQQAVNMTETEQLEYQDLLRSKLYYIFSSAIDKPSNHRVYKSGRTQPTWAKYILLTSIYGDRVSIRQLFSNLGNLHIDDYTAEYRRWHPLTILDPPPNAFTPVNTPAPLPNASPSTHNLPAAASTEIQDHAPSPEVASTIDPLPLPASFRPPLSLLDIHRRLRVFENGLKKRKFEKEFADVLAKRQKRKPLGDSLDNNVAIDPPPPEGHETLSIPFPDIRRLLKDLEIRLMADMTITFEGEERTRNESFSYFDICVQTLLEDFEQRLKEYVDRSREQTCSHVDTRCNELSIQIDSIDRNELVNIESRLGTLIHQRFNALETRNKILDSRLDSLNNAINGQYKGIESQIKDMRDQSHLSHYVFAEKLSELVKAEHKDASTQTERLEQSVSTQTEQIVSKTRDWAAQTD